MITTSRTKLTTQKLTHAMLQGSNSIELPDRLIFLDNYLQPVEIQRFDNYASDTNDGLVRPRCQLCKTTTLSHMTHTMKAAFGGASYERAVRLPCGHIFGEVCIRRHLDTLNMHEIYNDECPQCGMQLYEQEDATTRREKLRVIARQIACESRYRRLCDWVVQPCMWLMVVCIVASVCLPCVGFGALLSFSIAVVGITQFTLVCVVVVRTAYPEHRNKTNAVEDDSVPLLER